MWKPKDSACQMSVCTGPYAAREAPIAGVCAQSIWLELRRRHRTAAVFDTYCEINLYVAGIVRPGNLVLYLGAGLIDKAARDICGGVYGRVF